MSLAVGKRIVAGAIGITNQQDISDHSKAISANQNNPEIKGSLRYGIRELNKYVDSLNKMTIKNVDPVRVGTWIDGKPLYEQVFVAGNVAVDGREITIRHGIPNVDNIWVHNAVINRDSDGYSLPVCAYGGTSDYGSAGATKDSIILAINRTSFTGNTTFITLRFTSTTDVPDTDMTLEELENEEY